MTELEQNVKKVLSTVNGRATVLAATKTVAPERINLIYDMGIHTIGENRVQELLFPSVRRAASRLSRHTLMYHFDDVTSLPVAPPRRDWSGVADDSA